MSKTFEEKIKEAITGKPMDKCLGCVEQAVKEIRIAADEEVSERLRKIGVAIDYCSKCNQEIFWIKTKNGRAAPITLKLISHFADCPNAKDFRKL